MQAADFLVDDDAVNSLSGILAMSLFHVIPGHGSTATEISSAGTRYRGAVLFCVATLLCPI